MSKFLTSKFKLIQFTKLSDPKNKLINVRMSSKKKGTKEKQSPANNANPSAITMGKSNGVIIKVLAKPGAKQNSITEITEEGVGVHINAPPVDGEANTELVKYLSKVLGLRKSDISLDKGSKSRQKVLKLEPNVLSVDEVLQLLNNEIKK